MTSQEKKKKKKPLVQIQVEKQPELELSGSERYLTEHKIDEIIKKGKDRIKHAITVSDIKLTKTKKQIIKEMAEDMEKAGYAVNQICDRLTKSLKGLVSERYVRELDAKYKNPEQSEVAKMQQNHDGDSLYRQQEQVRKKDIKEITFDDLKLLNNLTKVKQVAKHQMEKALWWEQQVKQNEGQPAPILEKQQPEDKDKIKIIADLTKENAKLKETIELTRKLFMAALDPKLSDQEAGQQIRKAAKQHDGVSSKQSDS